MTNTQHTPGPWFVTPDGAAVYEKDGFGYRGETVCRLVGHPFTTANARLIAAAPDLLDALAEMLADADTLQEPYRNEAICERARAAIAKATGG